MRESLTIEVDQLRAAVARILDALERNRGPIISFAVDHYWSIPVTAAFDLDDATVNLTVGQVSDDVEEVRGFVGSGEEPVALWHELAHLTGILRALELQDLPGAG